MRYASTSLQTARLFRTAASFTCFLYCQTDTKRVVSCTRSTGVSSLRIRPLPSHRRASFAGLRLPLKNSTWNPGLQTSADATRLASCMCSWKCSSWRGRICPQSTSKRLTSDKSSVDWSLHASKALSPMTANICVCAG
ncbi:hypothetical protein BD626DRAFT_113698 [Schizophyllum amplum]|uniref:Uncharacterized protein n=1 Tax=Schizophyllum amplum TaxID=97359 RepID=A0A550CU05_9AGAR|nr:hypothetical protein BD626DRAFT_113698 [Auriculariopsis ampla]